MSPARFSARLVLVLALVASTQGLLLAQSAWLVNRDWIAETLCVSPETDCDGSCQLADRMAHMVGDGHTHEHDEAPVHMLELALSIRALVATSTLPAPADPTRSSLKTGATFDTGHEALTDVFHPPRRQAA